MRLFYRFATITSLLLFLTLPLLGQQRNLVTGEFNNLQFSEFVKAVESSTDYHFFYRPLAVDSLKVNISAQNKSIGSLLDQLFTGTDLHYAVDQRGNIFIT